MKEIITLVGKTRLWMDIALCIWFVMAVMSHKMELKAST
jgi:hypothetical protein